jgi:hypothetical protein
MAQRVHSSLFFGTRFHWMHVALTLEQLEAALLELRRVKAQSEMR